MGCNDRFYVDIMNLNREVTGSAILLVVTYPDKSSKRILIDCGLFQEPKYMDLNMVLPFKSYLLDHVIVTHNHLDHIGRLPLLVKNGFRNPIHVSEPTEQLIKLSLRDAYKISKSKNKHIHQPSLYRERDLEETFYLLKSHPYNQTFDLEENIKLTFFKNGHLPGAVIGLLQFSCSEHEDINVLFTGDYNDHNMFFKVPQLPAKVRELPLTIIQECTYGDTDSSQIDYVFEGNLVDATRQNKSVVIPVLSLGRAQELMYTLKQYQERGIIDTNIPIYFDGKLGIKNTHLYLKGVLDLDLVEDFLPSNFEFVTGPVQRAGLIQDSYPKIILTTSGMGSHGPAQCYLPAFLQKRNALIHFVSYLAEGTAGRSLHDHSKDEIVSVAGLKVKKSASVKFTSEFSSHAKSNQLLAFLEQFKQPKLVLINHGSSEAQDAYSQLVLNKLNPKSLGILNGQYLFRINPYGLVKTISTKFY